MKEPTLRMIKAVIRLEREDAVMAKLESEGFYAVTKTQVLGRGRQRGIQVGKVAYDELAKLILLLAVDDEDCPRAVRAIEEGAYTGYPGDGKIFIQDVMFSVTIRTEDAEAFVREKTP